MAGLDSVAPGGGDPGQSEQDGSPLAEPCGTAPAPSILMIDDDEEDYILTQDLLRVAYGPDFCLDWVSNWNDAIAELGQRRHGVYLLDYCLGKRDGIELVREAICRGCEAPIILLTGNGDRDVDLEAMRAGAADYLVKGETTAVVIERSIRYALARHRSSRQVRRQVSWEMPDILLVDDDEDDYILTRGMLTEIYGGRCKVDWVSSWDQALPHFREWRHDAYLIDYRLGERNGIDLVREAIELGCQAPIILLTGDGSREVDLEAMRAGAADYLVKSELTTPLLDRALRYAMERFRGEQRLAELAKFDQLTGLANRVLFREFLGKTLARAERYHRPVALAFLDLDRFKIVNDTLGHHAGDQLLKGVAERLKDCVRASDIVARLGGDEFAIVLDEIVDPLMVGYFCDRVLQALRKPFLIDGEEFHTTTSIGIAIYPMDADNIEDLLKSADTAMYHAKEAGADNFQYYTMSMHIKASKVLSLEKHLHRALERDEFFLCYQPQIGSASGRIVGFEALLRWRRPEQGVVRPADFISVAEETRLIIPIGRWVLHEACAQARRWLDGGTEPFRMSVNVAARQCRDNGFYRTVRDVLLDTGLPPECLEIELTESSLLKDQDAVRQILRRLMEIGVTVALDDFGTGFSSLTHLKTFPGSSIKIDRSFVNSIVTSNADAQIVSGVIQMAHGLDLKVVAEGVESGDQVAVLLRHGCDIFQGYFFSLPLPPEEITPATFEKRFLQPDGPALVTSRG
jgi:diguanylate cyclase (GGDEF)-like protein